MSDHHSHRTSESESRVSAGRGSLLTTIVHLWPYIWPADRDDLKLRVLGSLFLLLAAKLATIAVPFTFKWATDALAGHGTAPIAASDWLLWAIAAPIAMTIAYGGMDEDRRFAHFIDVRAEFGCALDHRAEKIDPDRLPIGADQVEH